MNPPNVFRGYFIKYEANKNCDLTNSINFAITQWVCSAASFGRPVIVNFHISDGTKENEINLEFPVFPAFIERDDQNELKAFLAQDERRPVNKEKNVKQAQLQYEQEILNYLKNKIGSIYLKAEMLNDEKTKKLCNLKMMHGFDFEIFKNSLYAEDEFFDPKKHQKYKNDYILASHFEDVTVKLLDDAKAYLMRVKPAASPSEFGE